MAWRRRGRVGRKPRRVQRKKVWRKKAASRFNQHVFKRRCASILIGLDQSSIPTLVQDGNGAAKLGAIGSGPYLSNTAQFGLSYNAQLGSVVENTDFTQLFDRYKIAGVKLRILYQNNMGDPNSHALPGISMAFDGDDNGIPSNKEDVTRKYNARTYILNANRPKSLYFKPRVTKMVYQGAITSAYTSERSCFIDCSNPTVEHYGYKFWIDSFLSTTGAQSGQLLTIEPTLYLVMKDPQ